ncbi:uncharacterized protein LOC133192846 [Saccostrea echinata]|uniref:uncharacterized protein LOC133192846 n=1 Tax=Saccostrea echinata TaxID=191078 RepID=UPI002A8058D3|nr:uncharacterized protein LOC133192846 [Saccostrea echinata]
MCFCAILFVFGQLILFAEGSCTFPSYLVGEWTSAERGSLTITTNTIYNYKVFIPSADPNNPTIDYYNFTCLTQVSTNRYTIKSVNFNVLFGTNVFFYICLDIYNVNDQLNYYYHATAVDNLIRENMVGIAEDRSNSQESICTRSYIDPVNFITLLRKDAVESNAIQTLCPETLQMVYSNITFTSNSATSDNCATAQLDGCTNKTMLNFSQDGCTQTTLSDGGVYTCIYSKTIDGQLYFSAWNNDETISSTTYRFSCFKMTNYLNGTVFLEENPNFCGNSVNFTEYPSASASVEIKDITDSCQTILPTTTEAPFVADLNYLFILLGLFMIVVIFISVLLFKRLKLYMKKRKEERAFDVRKREKVRPQHFNPKRSIVNTSKPVNYFKPKRPIQIVPLFKSEFSIENLPIQPPPKITCIYTDSIVDYMRGRIRRPDGLSLYSFDSAIFRATSPLSSISVVSRYTPDKDDDDDDVSFGSASC